MSDESYEVANHYIQQGILGKVVMAGIDYSRNCVDTLGLRFDPDAKPGVNLAWNTWLGPAPNALGSPAAFPVAPLLGLPGDRDRSVHPPRHPYHQIRWLESDRVVGLRDLNFTDRLPKSLTLQHALRLSRWTKVVLVSSMANDTAIEHVIRGHSNTSIDRRFRDHSSEVSDGLISQTKEQRRNSRLLVYKKTGGEDVRFTTRTYMLPSARDALKCDVDLGYTALS
jgi:hypothetical protein